MRYYQIGNDSGYRHAIILGLHQLADEGGGGAGEDFDGGVVVYIEKLVAVGRVVFCGEQGRENAHLVRRGAAAEFLVIATGRSFDEDLERLADITLVAFQAQLVLKGDYLVETAGLLLRSDVIRIIAGSQCSRTLPPATSFSM